MKQEILQSAILGLTAFCLFGARVFTVLILMGKVSKKSSLVAESLIALVLLGGVLVTPQADGLGRVMLLPQSLLSFLCAFGFGVKVVKISFLYSIPSELLDRHRSLVDELCNYSALALAKNLTWTNDSLKLQSRDGKVISVITPGFRWLAHVKERFVTSDHAARGIPFKRLRAEIVAESDRLEGVVRELKGSVE